MSWFLEKISIEGFRGINNAGSPLEITFHTDKINSIFAANGVGKTSIFDAVTYAITGVIPKLSKLPASEKANAYYLNAFHPSGISTIALHLQHASGGNSRSIFVTRDKNGTRLVSTSDGSDGEALLSELDREFVLLDAATFIKFIEDTDLNRGRSFSSLLGLGAYSSARKSLQSLSNTRAFNNHFGVNAKDAQIRTIDRQISSLQQQIERSFFSLTGRYPASQETVSSLRDGAQASVSHLPLIGPFFTDKNFNEVNFDDCVRLIRDTEGGALRDELSTKIRHQERLKVFVEKIPDEEIFTELEQLVLGYSCAIEKTDGNDFLIMYKSAMSVASSEDWNDKTTCPVCDRQGDHSVVDHLVEKISAYEEASRRLSVLIDFSSSIDWNALAEMEVEFEGAESISLARMFQSEIKSGSCTLSSFTLFREKVSGLKQKVIASSQKLSQERVCIEKSLPPSLVALTESVEVSRLLQSSFQNLENLQAEKAKILHELDKIGRVRAFLSDAAGTFSVAEAEASTRRLSAVEPLCKQYFSEIMFGPIVPSILKKSGAEDLNILLEKFYEAENVSAQALLSESYKNAFSISVYLAAATLYAGPARFLLLDDITSSLDAGHQFHLMELLRTKFARPLNANGPQLIILSHDNLLEKYFNVNGSSGNWIHHRIAGTPRTSVLLLSNAVNRVRDETKLLLQAGNSQDAAPRIRQYLEYSLEQIIVSCKIPVPMDLALSDDKKLASSLISAIDAQIKLHHSAGSLVLDQNQQQNLTTSVMTIVSNFLSHWGTGQVQAFSPNALLGVMAAIASYTDCFRYEPQPGAPKKFYRSLSQR